MSGIPNRAKRQRHLQGVAFVLLYFVFKHRFIHKLYAQSFIFCLNVDSQTIRSEIPAK